MKLRTTLLALLLVGCASGEVNSQEQSVIQILDHTGDQQFRYSRRTPTVALILVEGHKYIVAMDASTTGGIAIVHAYSCACGRP